MPSPPPAWVQALKPAGPQGSELLAQERAQSTVDVDKLAELLKTKEVLQRQEKMLQILEKEKVFDKSQNNSLGRVERIQRSLAKGKRLQQLSVQHHWSQEEYHAANDLIGEPTPYGLHATMFLVGFFFFFPFLTGMMCERGRAEQWANPSVGIDSWTRNSRAVQALLGTGREVRDPGLLRPDGTGPRVQRAWSRDHGHLQPRR